MTPCPCVIFRQETGMAEFLCFEGKPPPELIIWESLKQLTYEFNSMFKKILYSHSLQTCLPQCDFRFLQMIENGDLEEKGGHGYLRSGKRVLKEPAGGH